MSQRFRKIFGCFLSLMFLAFLACERNQSPIPDLQIDIEPANGLTTTQFNFDLSETFKWVKNDRLFVRFDWNGDGQFDTPYLHEQNFVYRYYAPGSYQPIVEVKNLEGDVKQASYPVLVEQGYSPPRAGFIMSQDTGHIMTDFVFDARITQDDEDSLSTLLFSWDFEGDGVWDIQPGDETVVTHRYDEPDFYTPTLSVLDPSGRGGKTIHDVLVTLTDPCIIADFSISPGMVIQNEDVLFNAGLTYNQCGMEEVYHYRWDFNNDRIYDTEWSGDPTVIHSFPLEQYYFVTVEVKSSRGVKNTRMRRFWVYHQNQPPLARINMSTFGGNTGTEFRFDAWASRDTEDAPTQMLGRWDFDGDGIWDTDFGYEKEYYYQYNQPGDYKVGYELIDRGGLKDTAYQVLYVNDSDYETGILLDKRGYAWNYYGTILIGDQWWLSKNLQVDHSRLYDNWAYLGAGLNVPFYGFLYTYNYLPAVCPDGWRVPTREDWDQLFANFDSESLFEELVLGGNSGFNAVFGGLNTSTSAGSGEGIERYGHYWSSTKLRGGPANSVWVISLIKAEEKLIMGWSPEYYYYSVRCVRDNK